MSADPRTPDPSSACVRNHLFRMTLRSEVVINAHPQRLWDTLTNFESYPQWHPAIRRASGEAKAGTLLRILIQWPGLRPYRYDLKILAVTPLKELRWVGHTLVRGLYDGVHRFLIEGAGEGSRVTQVESFSGLLVPFLAYRTRENVLQGFVQSNANLKNYLERSAPRPA